MPRKQKSEARRFRVVVEDASTRERLTTQEADRLATVQAGAGRATVLVVWDEPGGTIDWTAIAARVAEMGG